MVSPEHGPWEPLRLQEVVELFKPAPFRWWVTGGNALEMYLGASWRAHDDTDVGVLRRDASQLIDLLAGWEIHLAAAGVLRPWRGTELSAGRSENNLWCRPASDSPWSLDITISDGDDHDWIYRRDPSIRVGWGDAMLTSSGGVDYLSPELQLLYKSKNVRPKDTLDATTVIAALEPEQLSRLASYLHPTHDWQKIIDAVG